MRPRAGSHRDLLDYSRLQRHARRNADRAGRLLRQPAAQLVVPERLQRDHGAVQHFPEDENFVQGFQAVVQCFEDGLRRNHQRRLGHHHIAGLPD